MGVPMDANGDPFQWLCGPPPYWIGKPASNGPQRGQYAPTLAGRRVNGGSMGSQWDIDSALNRWVCH